MRPLRSDDGFASPILALVLLPFLGLVFLLCIDVGFVGYSWARADISARAGAAAAAAGEDPRAAAAASLSRGMLRHAEIEVSSREVRVSVRPESVTGLDRWIRRVEVRAGLGRTGDLGESRIVRGDNP